MKNIEKVKWDTKFINNLPDAASAYILPGGKKDKEGKTVPRGLRLLPHHNANVKNSTENTSVDLPHLRNALARVKQIKASANVKNSAQNHLMKHAKALLPAYGGGKKPINKQEDIMKSRKSLEAKVIIQKSALPLKNDEPLKNFLKSMHEAVFKHLKEIVKTGVDADSFPVEVYSDKIIVDLYVGSDDGLAKKNEPRMKYYRVSYKRNIENGEFEFDKTEEVVKQIVFVPKEKPMQKSFLAQGIKVIVEKQITLEPNENIQDFVEKLETAARADFRNKIGKKLECWLVAEFEDKVVIKVCDNGETAGEYYQASYKRNEDGEFSFGDYEEVIKNVTFTPKGVTVKKSFWDGIL